MENDDTRWVIYVRGALVLLELNFELTYLEKSVTNNLKIDEVNLSLPERDTEHIL